MSVDNLNLHNMGVQRQPLRPISTRLNGIRSLSKPRRSIRFDDDSNNNETCPRKLLKEITTLSAKEFKKNYNFNIIEWKPLPVDSKQRFEWDLLCKTTDSENIKCNQQSDNSIESKQLISDNLNKSVKVASPNTSDRLNDLNKSSSTNVNETIEKSTESKLQCNLTTNKRKLEDIEPLPSLVPNKKTKNLITEYFKQVKKPSSIARSSKLTTSQSPNCIKEIKSNLSIES